MRILHAADLHLDSAFGHPGRPDPAAAALEQRQVLDQLVDLALNLRPQALLIAGDLFEAQHVRPDTPHYVAKQFARLEPIPVLIAPGNHDPYRFYRDLPPLPGHVRIFGRRWAAHRVGDGVVWGYGHYDAEEPDCVLRRLRIRDHSRVNAVLFHGSDLDAQPNRHERFAPFRRDTLARTGTDYGALGHYHGAARITSPSGRLLGCYPGAIRGLNSGHRRRRGVILAEVTKRSTVLQTFLGTPGGFVPGELDF